MKRLVFVICLISACKQTPSQPPNARVMMPPAADAAVGQSPDVGIAPEPAECTAVAERLWACPDDDTLTKWATKNHHREPAESSISNALVPPDPTPIQDGLSVYEDFLNGAAHRTRTHLELWANTPTYNANEQAFFAENPTIWKAVAEFRAADAREQTRLIRSALHAKDKALLRAMVLRDGVFFLRDADVAVYASKYVGLRQLFDAPEIELHRSGLRYVLKRDNSGNYLHFEPLLDEAVATLHLLDRVGPAGELAPILGYGLQAMRRQHGLSNVVAKEETEAGRKASAHFFNGEVFEGALTLDSKGKSVLAVVANPQHLNDVRDTNVNDRATTCGLLETTDLMVRERLEFDEPKVEYGQQDGRLRPRFEKAYAAGETTYTMNGVTYKVFDAKGRPRVPQLCIDFVTDAVQRSQGSWWAAKGEESAPAPFNIRDYMQFRTVRTLLELGRVNPSVATVQSLDPDAVVPYEDRTRFFENLWDLRDEVREGDVIVIYGLRDDNQNHFHSFYVRETDPIYGMPVILTANPGFARIQSWHEVMWESPKRSIRNIVRWNPDWLRSPAAVDAAFQVRRSAQRVAGEDQVPQSK
ncbi:MAG: hypothetical protein R3E66_04515 [bacterium]